MHPLARRILRILFAAFILIVMVNLVRTGLADFIRLRATSQVDGILNRNQPFTAHDLDTVLSTLKLSARIDPGNPLIPEYEGHVYFLRARLTRSLPELSEDYLEIARSDYLKALALRRNSPYLWSSLCVVDDHLLEYEQGQKRLTLATEFGTAIAHAGKIGPWEYAVQKIIAVVGGRDWSTLDDSQRQVVITARQHLAYYAHHPRKEREWTAALYTH